MSSPNPFPSAQIKANLKSPGTWTRLLFMVIFAFIVGLVRFLLWFVILFQVATQLLTGGVNPALRNFGKTLGEYLYQIVLFLTYNSEEMPFPFADPGVEHGGSEGSLSREGERGKSRR